MARHNRSGGFGFKWPHHDQNFRRLVIYLSTNIHYIRFDLVRGLQSLRVHKISPCHLMTSDVPHTVITKIITTEDLCYVTRQAGCNNITSEWRVMRYANNIAR